MSSLQQTKADALYWPAPIARAVPALIVAGVITFSSDHSSHLGLAAFGAFAIATGLVVGFVTWRRMPQGTSRSLSLGQAVISLIAGVVALVWVAGGIGVFLLLVSMWAALTGFLELYSGLRSRPRAAMARDWVYAGAFTAVLAVVLLLIEPEPVLAVGLFGAYAVVLGVYLVIGGLSLKWSGTDQPSSLENGSAATGAATDVADSDIPTPATRTPSAERPTKTDTEIAP